MAKQFSWQNSYTMLSFTFIAFSCICNAKKFHNKKNITNDEGGFRGMFIFGSSVVDNGNNNNNIGTLAKANYLPYGIDFATGTTGRFSNGKNVADFISDYLNLPLIPSFADSQTRENVTIVHGVNFASGGSGILDETGIVVGKVISLNEQIRNFEGLTLPELERQLRCQRTKILPNYLFLIAAGNNDYLLNYFLLGQLIPPQDFAAKLISTYSDQLEGLYNMGARKFALLSVYPLGCSPVVSKGQGCLPLPNAIVTMFYDQLILMVNQVKPRIMPDAEIIVLNSVKVISDIVNNPGTAGIINVSDPCCEVSANGLSCKANGKICDNRNSYAYLDGQHNTESLSAIIATKALTSCDPFEVYPFNLRKLAQA